MSANPWKQKTDAAVFHAQQLLSFVPTVSQEKNAGENAGESAGKGAGAATPRGDSCEVSVWLLLREAGLLWLNELAHYSQYSGPMFKSFEEFAASGYSKNPEAEYLINLNQQPDSWVYRMLSVATSPGAVFDSVAGRDAKPSVIQPGLIAVSASSEEDNASPGRVLREFKTYISDVRARQTEW